MREASSMFSDKTINRLAMTAILPGLEMSVQSALEILNSARKALGMPLQHLTTAGQELDIEEPLMLPATHEERRGRGRPAGHPGRPEADASGRDPRLLLRIKQYRHMAWSVARIAKETGISVYRTGQLVKLVDPARESDLEKAAAVLNAPEAPAAGPATAREMLDEVKAQPVAQGGPEAEARGLRAQGLSYGNIAKRLHVSTATANRWASKVEIPATTPGYTALRSHTVERWRLVKEAGIDTGGHLPTNKVLEKAKKILAARAAKAEAGQ